MLTIDPCNKSENNVTKTINIGIHSILLIKLIPVRNLLYKDKNNHFSVCHSKIPTVFTWLNAAATIRHVLKIDAATIQRRPLFEGGVYYTLST